MLAFSIYIIALLATVICLAQQRAAFTLESRGVITEPVLHFTETVDKGLFIAVFQQGDRFAKTLIIALDQRQIIFRRHNDVGVKLRILGCLLYTSDAADD